MRVFKHLQNEINRLEKQAFLDQNADRASADVSPLRPPGSSRRSSPSVYTSWNQEATSHKSERQQQNKEGPPPARSRTYSQRFFVPPTFKTVGNPVGAQVAAPGQGQLLGCRSDPACTRTPASGCASNASCLPSWLSSRGRLCCAGQVRWDGRSPWPWHRRLRSTVSSWRA